MENCGTYGETRLVASLRVEEHSGYVHLELDPIPRTRVLEEETENSTPQMVNKAPVETNEDYGKDLQRTTEVNKLDMAAGNEALQETLSTNHVLTETASPIDTFDPKECPSIDRTSFTQTHQSRNDPSREHYSSKANPLSSVHCPSCGINIQSVDIQKSLPGRDVSCQIRSTKVSKDDPDRFTLREEVQSRALQRERANRHRSFITGTRSETLESVRRVALNGTESLKNRLRLAVLRENEIRMDAEMTRAEFEATKTEKALAEILLADTYQHETMLQKDLHNAVMELQRRPTGDSSTDSKSTELLKQELQEVKETLELDKRNHERSESERRWLMRDVEQG
eukprot:g6245.t2